MKVENVKSVEPQAGRHLAFLKFKCKRGITEKDVAAEVGKIRKDETPQEGSEP